MNRRYDKELEELIASNMEKGAVPSLLLHSCCAPCSSYVISYLSDYFYITVLYYNPNIYPEEEYLKRKMEQIRLISSMKTKYLVSFMDSDYDNMVYEDAICGLENEPERGSRCSVCFRLRLDKTAIMAKENNFDYFGSTLTVSPYKNAKVINEIGLEVGFRRGISFLVADFKKNDGYKKSIELSKEYNLYRQNFCGCKYSKRDLKEDDK